MSFLTESVRKLSRWITSSHPVSSLGKRKAVTWEDEGADSSIDYDSGLSNSSETNSDIDPFTSIVHCYSKIQPSAKRNDTSLQNSATLRSTEHGINERCIREELEEKLRQECTDNIQPQKGPATAGRTKVASQTRHVTFEPTAKPQSVVKPSPSKNPTRKTSACVLKSTTPKAQWADKPNTRARELLKNDFHGPAAILDDLKEPEYACRDVEIRDGVWQMMDQIEALARNHFSFELKDKGRSRAAFESMSEETVKIVGCVVSGGPAGTSGWEDLFIDSDKRQALVCAIIGNVIIEQVFQHIFFGGTEEQIKEVAQIQHTHGNHDGTFPPQRAADQN